jgi:type VI secretion system protein ImpC
MSAAEQPAAAGAAPAAAQDAGLLDTIVQATKPRTDVDKAKVKDYVGELVKQVLAQPGQTVSTDVVSAIKYHIAQIDKKLSTQLDEVLHHPDFQRLEGTWRGLEYLVKQSNTNEMLQIRVLNISKRDLFKDLDKAVEFDQSALFKKVYESEYGTLGGKPYGLLVGDYEFTKDAEDINLLKMVGGVAAASHAPFVAAASSQMFNMERFIQLPDPRDLAKIFTSVEYASWQSFRKSEDSRYIGLTLPHVLGRLPYGPKFTKVDSFNYEENVDGRNHDKYLWMNAAWAYAARVTDAVDRYGWMARTRGVEGGGKVENLPVHTFPTDEGDVAMKCPTEIAISDRREFELSNLGFLPLLWSKDNDFAVFMGAQSCQQPTKYFDPGDNANAELSAKFNYIMCVSRFAHYLKVMARDRIGSFMEKEECERWLNEWIMNYTIAQPEMASDEQKAKYPLAKARVEVRSVAGKPGYYEAVAFLRPHFQLEALDVSLRLVAELPPPKK